MTMNRIINRNMNQSMNPNVNQNVYSNTNQNINPNANRNINSNIFQTYTHYTLRQTKLLNHLRMLWEQHIHWTRSFIISTAENIGDLSFVTNQLLQNPVDFADIFRKFYDKQTVLRFEELFKQHLLIASDLVNAAKNNNTASINEARMKWYENADELASFFAGINPYWNKQTWQNLLHSHLQMTENEAVLRLSKKYADDVKIYSMIENEALQMADYMFYGLIRHFNYM